MLSYKLIIELQIWKSEGDFDSIREYDEISESIALDPWHPQIDKEIKIGGVVNGRNTYKIIGNEIELVYGISENTTIIITIVTLKNKN
ncbi:MAG: hypothetical protein LBO69_00625 [Ignavibacteria bacterium]|jgi:hypothetical protein|nr:hypothetical protein [Ignavibacteria bacterium]